MDSDSAGVAKDDHGMLDGKNKLIIIAIAVLVFFAIFSSFFSGNENKRDKVVVNSITAAPEVDQESVNDADASLRIFNSQLEKSRQAIEALSKQLEENERKYNQKISELENNTRKQLNEVVQQQISNLREQGDEEYNNVLNIDKDGRFGAGLPPEGLFDDELTKEPSKQVQTPPSPYGANYIVLSRSASRIGLPQSSVNDFDDKPLIGNPIDAIRDRSRDAVDKKDDSGRDSGRSDRSVDTQQIAVEPGDEKVNSVEVVSIPALSKSPVTTWFGVNCPIGGSLVNKPSDIPARPIVLPVNGVFKGPNGGTVNIGKVHLYGTCSARRTGKHNIGRAEIKINRLSYWDASGNTQYLPASGFLIDESDNTLDIAGYIDKVSSANMLKQATASAALAYAATLSSKEYTAQSSPEGAQFTLSGDEVTAGAGAGAAAFFKSYADRWLEESLSDVDTVHVPAGRSISFISDIEIKVNITVDNVESEGDNDVLI